jgi:hypothetical protein
MSIDRREGVSREQDEEFVDIDGVRRYVENTSVCRREFLTHIWDGVLRSCRDVPGCLICDVCRLSKSRVKPYLPATTRQIVRMASVGGSQSSDLEILDERKRYTDLLLLIYTHLIEVGACPIHFLLTGKVDCHSARACTLQCRTDLEPIARGLGSFEEKIKWQKGYLCWFCFFPQFGIDKRFHDSYQVKHCSNKSRPLELANHPGKHNFGQHSKSFINGIMWAIYKSKEVQRQASTAARSRATLASSAWR